MYNIEYVYIDKINSKIEGQTTGCGCCAVTNELTVKDIKYVIQDLKESLEYLENLVIELEENQ